MLVVKYSWCRVSSQSCWWCSIGGIDGVVLVVVWCSISGVGVLCVVRVVVVVYCSVDGGVGVILVLVLFYWWC